MLTYQPNCTFPLHYPAGFIYGPDIRSTLDIVWSCTAIILLSTWSVLHLTVPPDIEAKSTIQRIRKQVYLLQRKLSWMGIMLMFPEYLLGIGACNWFAARCNNHKLEQMAKDDAVPWSIVHTIHADMGGVAIRFLEEPSAQNSPANDVGSLENRPDLSDDQVLPERLDGGPSSGDRALKASGTTTKGYENDVETRRPPRTRFESDIPKFLRDFSESQQRRIKGLGEIPWRYHHRHAMLAIEYSRPIEKTMITKANNLSPLHGNIWILDSAQLAVAREHNIISRLPNVRVEVLQDQSKSDGLVRALAVIQVGWLIVQLIARASENLSSSALEFSTLAFSACAIIIYIIEWKKPKDVAVPIYLDSNAIVSSETFQAIAEIAPTIFLRSRHYYMPQSSTHEVIKDQRSSWVLPIIVIVATILSTTLFGGIHLLAWNISFPSPVERTLWRTAALLVCIIPSVCALIVLVEHLIFGTTNKTSTAVVWIFGAFYLSSRVYLIVESFRSLYYLPADALQTTWSTYVPHVS